MSDSYPLMVKISKTRDYRERLALIAGHRGQLDDSFAGALDEAVAMNAGSQVQLDLSSFRAITLAEIVFVLAEAGDVGAAMRFAQHCLRAYLHGLRLLGENPAGSPEKLERLLTALLADAGEFRKWGLEEEGWQAYWIADPIYSAQETVAAADAPSTVHLLIAALTLERVGMREAVRQARGRVREELGDEERFRRELALAERLAGPFPAEIPEPTIYSGASMETCHRFTSHKVSVTCMQQVRCSKCRGAMHYGVGQLVSTEQGKTYRVAHLTCQEDESHPALTLYRDVTLYPSGSGLADLGKAAGEYKEKQLAGKGRA
jgi:hypothetical protein